ncbi:MAG: septum formation initiator family protein [Opitutales bacterium]|nr:septum formation initiator family protein [Opitutales bacterium]
MNTFRLILIFLCMILFLLAGVLTSRLVHSNNEEHFFSRKAEELAAQDKKLNTEFQLKQDYMRKMISDSDVIEQTIREKTGLSKPNEVIFKFED